jgi:hypothetical protein
MNLPDASDALAVRARAESSNRPRFRPLLASAPPEEGVRRHAGRAETELAGLAASTGPIRHALAALAARLLDCRGYERLCYARVGDYARERAGLSGRQLHDLAHVHRAFAALPRLQCTLVANELPWSKVRLVARVATPADEEAWIARARALPIRRLESEVRARVPHGLPAEPGDDGGAPALTRVSVRCTPGVREKWMLAHELAQRVAGQRLRAAEALEWVTAEASSAISLARCGTDLVEGPAPQAREDASDQGGDGPLPGGCARDILPREPASLEPLLAGLEEADAFELDRRLRVAVRLEQTLDAAIAPLLRVVTSAEHEWTGGYQTLETYAPEQLGMSASKARALLRIERAGDACPELRESFRAGRLSWPKAQCLVPLLLLDLPGEWRPRWLAWAERVTVRRLELDVERALLLRAGHHLAWQRCKYHPERAQDAIPELERQMCAVDVDTEATEQLTWRVPRDLSWLFAAVRESFRAKLQTGRSRPPSDGEAFEALLDHALATWTLRETRGPGRHPVVERDGYLCAVPGCSSRRNLHDHHVVFRSAGGSDVPENRITLCAFHHQRCLHAGRLRIRGRAPDRLVFELGVRAAGPPLARYGSGDLALDAGAAAASSSCWPR